MRDEKTPENILVDDIDKLDLAQPRRVNRRRFLNGSGAVLGGAIVAGVTGVTLSPHKARAENNNANCLSRLVTKSSVPMSPERLGLPTIEPELWVKISNDGEHRTEGPEDQIPTRLTLRGMSISASFFKAVRLS